MALVVMVVTERHYRWWLLYTIFNLSESLSFALNMWLRYIFILKNNRKQPDYGADILIYG